MFLESPWRKGLVKNVGKAKGKDEHCCWIEEDDEVLYKRDFPKVPRRESHWRKILTNNLI